jgi:hypothetical protein
MTNEKGVVVIELHINDVLFGRGKANNNWYGNVYFRTLISQYRDEYRESRRFFKTMIASRIKNVIQSQDPPGRFLAKNDITGTYHIVSDDRSIEKICQALREKIKTKQQGIWTTSMNDDDDAGNNATTRLSATKDNQTITKKLTKSLIETNKYNERTPSIRQVDMPVLSPNPVETSNTR